MNLPKLLMIVCVLLFGLIGILALFKKDSTKEIAKHDVTRTPLEVEIDQHLKILSPALVSFEEKKSVGNVFQPASANLPDANRIEELFNKNGTQLPIVETITYKSRVSWLKGRPAWLSDYANYYETSRHFIARSLNGKPDYFQQELAEGDRFNVLRKDKNFQFNLIVDTSRCRAWFYYTDLDTNEKILLKTYPVVLGRIDASKTSGLLTPLGKYTLGDRVAIYKPKITGTYQGKKHEMVKVFGTRWIPFEKEIEHCTAPAKGFGIHGSPWSPGPSGELVENVTSLGKYESDGCIRFTTADIEEIFAIVITKPTTIEIVRDFTESSVAE